MITIERIILLYLIIVNAAGFLLMLVDKIKAKRNAWRIPEATLMGVAAIGGKDSMSGAIVEDLDARCVCALLVGAVRAERFCDGALLSFFKDGSVCCWLNRLKEIDKEK